MALPGGNELKWRGMTTSDAFYLGVGLVAACCCLLMVVVGLSERNGTAALAAGAVAFVAVLPVLAYQACCTLRPVVLSQAALRVPVGFGTKVLSPDQVEGVGLLYFAYAGRRSPGWYPYVWHGAGERTQLGAMAAVTGQGLLIGRPGERARREVTWDSLNASNPGQMITKIYNWALEHQGRLGPIVGLARETIDTASEQERQRRPKARMWWSPDGTMTLNTALHLPGNGPAGVTDAVGPVG
jgi:hypothetical protein